MPYFDNYTIQFDEYLRNEMTEQGKTELSDVFPAPILQMPEDKNGVPFWERLYQMYCYREIGSETTTLFKIHFTDRAMRAYNEFYDKIVIFQEKFEKITEDNTDVITITGERTPYTEERTDLLNPIDQNTSSYVAAKQNISKTENWKETREESVLGDSLARRLRESMDFENIYEKALMFFDSLFMQLY